MDNRMIFDKKLLLSLMKNKQEMTCLFTYLVKHFKILGNYDMNVSNC